MANWWPRALTAIVAPRGGTLVILLALLSIVSLITNELTCRSVLAADFEGFDSDDIDDPEDLPSPDDLQLVRSPPPPATSLSGSAAPESHHDPTSSPKPPSTSDLWDEDEFEGIPIQVQSPDPKADPSDETPAASVPLPSAPAPHFSIRSYTVEIVCVSFLICFLINYFTGKRENEALALAWAAKFAGKDSLFEKNFSLLGTGDGNGTPLLLKEGQDVFKFYASGRRYCQNMLATMEMRSRHDLISRVLDLVFSKRDTITFEVVMNEDAMDHVVLALARRKMAKNMHKEENDLQRFASMGLTPPTGRKWVADELLVITESKEVAGDLITEVVLDQGRGGRQSLAWRCRKCCCHLKFLVKRHLTNLGNGSSRYTSDQRPGTHKKTLIFKFALPDANDMSDMTRLVALVPYYIDLIGRYKLSSQARSKTEAARAKAAQEEYKELRNLRQEVIQKKAEKKKLEVAESKLSAEAIRKKEEKDRARQLKKSMPKVKMLRSH